MSSQFSWPFVISGTTRIGKLEDENGRKRQVVCECGAQTRRAAYRPDGFTYRFCYGSHSSTAWLPPTYLGACTYLSTDPVGHFGMGLDDTS